MIGVVKRVVEHACTLHLGYSQLSKLYFVRSTAYLHIFSSKNISDLTSIAKPVDAYTNLYMWTIHKRLLQ